METPLSASDELPNQVDGECADRRLHEYLMRQALTAAEQSAIEGETPVGAVVFDPDNDGEWENGILAVAANRPIKSCDPTAHAEILALRQAGLARRNYRLTNLWLAVTLEPCAMCAGAISHARIGRLIYGAPDEKGGGVAHGARVFDQPTCHWRPRVVSGVLAEPSAHLLRTFFRARRAVPKDKAGSS